MVQPSSISRQIMNFYVDLYLLMKLRNLKTNNPAILSELKDFDFDEFTNLVAKASNSLAPF